MSAPITIAPKDLEIRLRDLPRPWSWEEVFGDGRPVEVEVGTGNGTFLVDAALRSPERAFLGIEVAGKFFAKALRRIAQKGAGNVRMVYADAAYVVTHCIPSASVVAAQTPASDVLAMRPDGVFLSNGPGDPQPCDYAIRAIGEILDAGIPTFGICLGYQLMALSSGARTVKMKFGHHGANHPVVDIESGKVFISSQNHGFAVDEKSLPDKLVATHRSLFDGSLQGIRRTDCPAFGFQGHPEASPGPRELSPMFARFTAMMEAARTQAGAQNAGTKRAAG